MSILSKVHGRVLIERVGELTERFIGEVRCDFRMRRGCVDEVLVIKQMSVKCMEKF